MTVQEYLDTRNSELLPCPFCGEAAHLTHTNPGEAPVQMIAVGCITDGCAGWMLANDYNTAKGAIVVWNKRNWSVHVELLDQIQDQQEIIEALKLMAKNEKEK